MDPPSEGIPAEVSRVVAVAFCSISLPFQIGAGFGCNGRVRGLPSHSPKCSLLECPSLTRAKPQPRTVPVLPCSCRAAICLDIYPSLSRQADDMRLCCEPVSTTAFSSFPAHCKSKKRQEMMCGGRMSTRVSRSSGAHELSSCQLIPAPRILS